VIDEIEDIIGIDATDAVRASAKNGDRHRRHPRGRDRQGAAADGRSRSAADGARSSTRGSTTTSASSCWCA
jgi:hypothetical protein